MPVADAWTDPSAGGSLDLAAGAVVTETVWDALISNFLWLGGASGTHGAFTPTVSQGGALTLSSAVGRYWQIGVLVFVSISITINSSGTGGQAVIIGGLPVTEANSTWSPCAGYGEYIDASPSTYYPITTLWASTSSLYIVSNGGTGMFGSNPAITAAAGDIISLTALYIGSHA